MRVFLTGATGFIGTAIIPELLSAGHQVLGMTRSDAGAQSLLAAGVQPHRADLEDLPSIRAGAAQADAVIHTAFDHNFTGADSFVENTRKDSRVIHALGEALAGSQRPLLITSGVGMGSPGPGQLAVEDHFDPHNHNPRVASEIAGAELSQQGLNVSVVRLPQVHDTRKQGLVTYLIQNAQQKGELAYVGDGATRWSAGPLPDVAHLYRLALEANQPGARYHAVSEEGVSLRDIAETLGKRLNLPVRSLTPQEAQAHFGWLAIFAQVDMSASSQLTRKRLGWNPTGPTLLADLANLQL